MANSLKLALGAIVGAAIGVAAGVLTAPKSGKETRADLKAKALDIKDKADEATQSAKDKATSMTNKAKQSVSDKIEGNRSDS